MENKEIAKKVQEYCKEKGVEISNEDAETFVKFVELGKENKLEGNDQVVYDYLSNENAELSDEQLEAVAGGQGFFGWVVDVISTPFRAIGTVVGGFVAALATPIVGLEAAASEDKSASAELKGLWKGVIDFAWGTFGK